MKASTSVTDYFYKGGLNCAESTMKVLIENGAVNVPKDTVRMMSGFGGGMQRGSVCGAVVSAVAAIGSELGRTDPQENRKPSADAVRKFINEFESEFGSIYCSELQKRYVIEHKLKSDGMYRSCTIFVEKAVTITMEILNG